MMFSMLTRPSINPMCWMARSYTLKSGLQDLNQQRKLLVVVGVCQLPVALQASQKFRGAVSRTSCPSRLVIYIRSWSQQSTEVTSTFFPASHSHSNWNSRYTQFMHSRMAYSPPFCNFAKGTKWCPLPPESIKTHSLAFCIIEVILPSTILPKDPASIEVSVRIGLGTSTGTGGNSKRGGCQLCNLQLLHM